MNQLAVRHQALLLFSFRLIIAHQSMFENFDVMRCKTFEETDIERGLFDFMFQLHVRLVSRISLVENSNTARAAVENSIMNQSLMLLQLRKLLYIGN